MMNKLIELKNLTKNFDDQQVLRGINLDIYEKEFLTLLGPSGCGKTTTLRIIAGFEEPSDGEVLFNGIEISKLPPYKREVNTVFQKYALFPHLNVAENIGFGLNLKKVDKTVIAQKVERMLKMVGLEGFGKRDVTLLSGGQQQRVAIARALVNEPKVLLLDEPLGALDAKIRKQMQVELKKIQQEVGITFIYVTHDQEEALSMSDTVVVMNNGEIQQIGSPTDIYNEPENRFVAGFIGESNIIEGTMIRDYLVAFDGFEFECVDKGFEDNEEIEVVLRPEDLDIVPKEEGMMTGTVDSVLFKGSQYEVIVETVPGTSVTVQMKVIEDNANEVSSADGKEKISANDFFVDIEDVNALDDKEITARADAQAWNPESDDYISITSVKYDIKPEAGTYPVTFSTSAGTMIQKLIHVVNQPFVKNERTDEAIMAFNFLKTKGELLEAQALDTDLKTWANAQAWKLSNEDESVDIYVDYDFELDEIETGRSYPVKFMTEGRELKVHTVNSVDEGAEVGLRLDKNDIHVMRKSGR